MAVRSKNAAKEAAVNEKKMIAGKQQMMRTAGRRSSYLTADQNRMLSYLSRDELKRWNSYSPMRQRKILEVIERRLERKGKAVSDDDWQTAGPGSYYIDNFSEEETDEEEPRNTVSMSGETDLRFLHEKRDAPIRTVEPAPIRSKEMVMRMGLPAASPSASRKRGSNSARGHPVRKAAAAREVQETEGKADKKRSDSRGSEFGSMSNKTGFQGMEETRKQFLHRDFPDRRNNTDTSDMPEHTGKQMMIRKATKREGGKEITARNSPYRSPVISEDANTGNVSRSSSTAGAAARSRREPDWKQIPLAMHQQELTEGIRNEKEGRNPIKAGVDPGTAPEQEVVPAEAVKDNAGPDGKAAAAAAVIAKAETGKQEAAAVAATQKKSAKAALAQRESIRRKSLVTSRSRFEKQDVLKKVSGRQNRNTVGNMRNGILNRRENRKKEASYRKAFVSELHRIISQDLRKSENIRQAQKSGQISATISELTGQTARSTVSTAALPIHAAMKVLTKRLREEFKKKLKEAVAALGRFAVSLGGPVLIILLIVLLLGGFLMAFISDQKENAGYGLGFQIVQEAMKHIGLPYVYGGTDLETGCDCSGFVWAIYNKFGYNLPRTAGDQYAYGRKISSNIDDWQLGDLIYYSQTGSVQSGGGRAEHIVIYAGNGQVISCGPVQVYSWDYRSDYYGTCRIIPDEPDGGDFSGSTNEEICWNYFISHGFSEAAAAGILGNMYVESGGTFDPSIHQYGGGPGRGLCQWEESYSGGSGRYNQLAVFAGRLGLSWDDITVQLMFVTHELNNGSLNPYFSKWGGVENFKHMTDPSEATYVFLCGFEYCGDPGQGFLESNFSLSTRVSHAQWAYTYYS